MDATEFWPLLEGLDRADRGDDLRKRVSNLEPGKIVEFGRAFQLAAAHTYDWGAVRCVQTH